MSFPVDKAFELLAQSREHGRLAHAYLIAGPEGSGKAELAARLIRLVNGLSAEAKPTRESLQGAHVTLVRPESKSRRISVDAIRAAEHTLQMSAPSGVTKFAVIVDCERMGEGAENAFLKTLEEPPRASMLLLLTTGPEQLLETILSRCIRIPLLGNTGPAVLSPGARELLDALRDHTLGERKGVSAALGLMGRFSDVLKAEKAAIEERNKEAFKAESDHYKKTTEGKWLDQREEYYKALTESEYLQVRARLLEFLVAWFGDALRLRHAGQHLDLPDYADATGALSQRLAGEELGRKIDAVEKLRSHLATNVHETLALESAFIRAFG